MEERKQRQGRDKTHSITESNQHRFCPTKKDKRQLGAIELYLVKRRELNDCTEIPNADIFRYLIDKVYKIITKKDRALW